MGLFDYTARPRFYALDADYRIEVDYVAANAATGIPAHVAPLDVVDYDGHEASNEDVFALASSLRGYDGDDIEDALDALLGYALELDAAERNVTAADVCDEEPVPFVPVDYDDERDPEAPDAWHMDDDSCDAFAAEFAELQRQSLTGRVLRALDRAAGGSR
jgi:hypothetical protein